MATLPDDFWVDVAWANGINDAAPTYTRLTRPVRQLVFSRGFERGVGAWEPGKLLLVVQDVGRQLDPRNRESPFWPNTKIRHPARVRTTVSGTTKTRWKGYLSRIKPFQSIDDTYARLEGVEHHATLEQDLPASVFWIQAASLKPLWWWPLAEGGGGVAYNFGREAAHGAYVDVNPEAVIIPYGHEPSTSMNKGLSSRVDVFGASSGRRLPSPCTVVAWTRGFNTGGGTGGTLAILGNGPGGTGGTFPMGDVSLYVGAGQAQATIWDGVSPATNTATVNVGGLDTGTPHMVVFRWTVGTRIALNVDNGATVSVAVGAYQGRPGALVVGNGTQFATTARNHNAPLSHVMIFDRELTDAEITALWVAGAGPWYGDRTDVRVQRLLQLAGVPLSNMTLDAGVETMWAEPLGLALPALVDIATQTEGGLFFIGQDETYNFRNRAYTGTFRGTYDARASARVTIADTADTRTDFETGVDTAFWLGNGGTLAQSPVLGTGGFKGERALRYTASAANSWLWSATQVVLPGELVSLEASKKSASAATDQRIRLFWYNAALGNIATTTVAWPAGAGWVRAVVAANAPAGAAFVRMALLDTTTATVGDTFDFDFVVPCYPVTGYPPLHDLEVETDENTFYTVARTQLRTPTPVTVEFRHQNADPAVYGPVSFDKPTSFASYDAALAGARRIVGDGEPKVQVTRAVTALGTLGADNSALLDMEIGDTQEVVERPPQTGGAGPFMTWGALNFWDGNAWSSTIEVRTRARTLWVEHATDGVRWDVNRVLEAV